MKKIWNFAMVLLATGVLIAHPASSVPIRQPLTDPDFIPSLQSTNGQLQASRTWNMPQAQEAPINDQVAEKEGLGTFVGGFLIRRALKAYRDRHTQSDMSDMQADLGDFANDGNIDLDALSDQLQNILSSQPSASTPTDSVAEAQRRRYWPIVRNFLDQIFSPTEEPSKQPDTTALAENALAPNADRTSSSQNIPLTQELPLNEQVAKEQWLGTFLPLAWNAYRAYRAYKTYKDSQPPESDNTNVQADLGDFAPGENIDLDALSDELQNILSSQPSASTPTESMAEAQRRRYWPIVRNFLDQIFSPTEEPSKQPDTTALAENALALNADRTSSSQNIPLTQELPLNEQVAKEQWLGTFLPLAWNAYRTYRAYKTYRDSQPPESDNTNVQADLGDFAPGGNIDLDVLSDQLQNILSSQPSASTPTESVAEAQRRRYWPIVRNFLNQIFSPTEAPSEMPDANAPAEDTVGTGSQTAARTQVWTSIRKFVGNLFAPKCGDALYIMAFTGKSRNAFTTERPEIELQVGEETKSVSLPDLPGEEFVANKGDLWRINLSEFGFTDTCITKGSVQEITLVEGGNDGWLIDSVVTFLRTEDSFVLLSSDIDVNRWIDGNGGSELERFGLSIV